MFALFQVVDDELQFVINQYGRVSTLAIPSHKVSDGEWHNVTVTVSGKWIHKIFSRCSKILNPSCLPQGKQSRSRSDCF